jgi:hypothetical protein
MTNRRARSGGSGIRVHRIDGKLERMRKALRLTALTAIIYAVASYLSFVC